MTAEIFKSKAHGETQAPTSKSMAHRYLICAALSEGVSRIKGVTYSEDVLATIDCLKTLGAKIETDNDEVVVTPPESLEMKTEETFYCRESGSTLRFILPLLLLSEKKQYITGSQRLLERPLDVYSELCEKHGLLFEKEDGRIAVCGKIKAGEYYIRGDVSSQFITGLMFALSTMEEKSKIHIIPPFESASYINMTVSALCDFGAEVDIEDDLTLCVGGSRLQGRDITVEGDYSGAAFLDALTVLGGNVRVTNLRQDSLQGDMIYKKYFALLDYGSPRLDVSDCPDLAPILMAVAAAKHGATLLGTKRLKIKESDRGSAMTQELSKFGADIEQGENSITVHKAKLHEPNEILNGHNDHRIVMALAVLGTLYGCKISDAQAVSKSFPDFFKTIAQLGVEVNLNDDK